MAHVYSAKHELTGKQHALKILKAHVARRGPYADMFLREARAAARIGDSPHIVEVTDAGTDDALDALYMVMPLLEGITLHDRLEQQRQNKARALSRVQVARLLRQLGETLDQSHRAGVVHRDLKPTNLMLTGPEDTFTLKVMDFGIAKFREEASGAGTVTEVGTPAYQAPEQLAPEFKDIAARMGVRVAREVSPATDVWALGLIAYEVLTGQPPGQVWNAMQAQAIPLKILDREPVASQRAGNRAGQLPSGFDPWFARCVARDATVRWQKFGEAATMLAGLLEEEKKEERSGGVAVETHLGVQTYVGGVSLPLPPPVPPPPRQPGVVETRLGVETYVAGMSQPVPPAPKPPAPPKQPGVVETSLASVLGDTYVAPQKEAPAPRKLPIVWIGLAAGVGVLGVTVIVAVAASGRKAETAGMALASAEVAPVPSGPDPAEVSKAEQERVAKEREGVVGEMVSISGGTTVLGWAGGDPEEKSEHEAQVTSFFLDRHEVTVEGWALCEKEGACATAPAKVSFPGMTPADDAYSTYCNGGKSGRGKHPMNCVTWKDADTFCGWAGKRLPTEAEWEYAAGGVRAKGAGVAFPWREGEAGVKRANACDASCVQLLVKAKLSPPEAMFAQDDGYSSTAPVGSFPEGATPQGVVDMAGNVSEWVADWFEAGKKRSNRGGNWLVGGEVKKLRVTKRWKDTPYTRDAILGFRCAR